VLITGRLVPYCTNIYAEDAAEDFRDHHRPQTTDHRETSSDLVHFYWYNVRIFNMPHHAIIFALTKQGVDITCALENNLQGSFPSPLTSRHSSPVSQSTPLLVTAALPLVTHEFLTVVCSIARDSLRGPRTRGSSPTPSTTHKPETAIANPILLLLMDVRHVLCSLEILLPRLLLVLRDLLCDPTFFATVAFLKAAIVADQ